MSNNQPNSSNATGQHRSLRIAGQRSQSSACEAPASAIAAQRGLIARIIIQARMGSSRLPAKISRPLAGHSLLARVVERLQACRNWMSTNDLGSTLGGWNPNAGGWGRSAAEPPAIPFTTTSAGPRLPLQLCVATTLDIADDWTVSECRRLGVPCFRGASLDVLDRYLGASADLRDSDLVIRATADNPFYCPQRTAAIIRRHRGSRAEYTCIAGLSYVVPEVMRAGALRAMATFAHDAECREHVTPYFRRPVGEAHFHVEQLPPTWLGLQPDVRLTVDTLTEAERAAGIYGRVGNAGRAFTLEDVYRDVAGERPRRKAA